MSSTCRWLNSMALNCNLASSLLGGIMVTMSMTASCLSAIRRLGNGGSLLQVENLINSTHTGPRCEAPTTAAKFLLLTLVLPAVCWLLLSPGSRR